MLTVKVVLLARFKEVMGLSSLEISIPKGQSVQDLCTILTNQDESWQQIFEQSAQSVKIAVNQEMAELSTSLADGDEVAFFPPVTGG